MAQSRSENSFQIEGGIPGATRNTPNENIYYTDYGSGLRDDNSALLLDEDNDLYKKEKKIKCATVMGIIAIIGETVLMPLITVILTALAINVQWILPNNSANARSTSVNNNILDDYEDKLCFCIEPDGDIDDCDCDGIRNNGNGTIWNQSVLIFAFITVLYEIINVIMVIIWLIYLCIFKKHNAKSKSRALMYGISLGGIKLKNKVLLAIILFRIVTFLWSIALISTYKPIECECDDDDDTLMFTEYYNNTYKNNESNPFIALILYSIIGSIDIGLSSITKCMISGFYSFQGFLKTFL